MDATKSAGVENEHNKYTENKTTTSQASLK